MTIVVIDDDPTGSQTVHSCPLLLCWDVDTLRRGLRHPSPLLFVLANTRALPPEAAAARNREIVAALEQALQHEGLDPRDLVLVSRGDSTLRGHGVLEPQVLAQELAGRFGPVQATLHVPAFLSGGRTTVDGEHRLHGQPVHTTPFARDGSFGFSTSQLDAWLEEKSAGAIPADSVLRLTGEQLSCAAAARHQDAAAAEPFQALVAWLQALDGNQPVVVDAEHQEQLDALGAAVSALQGQRRFLFRSAASLINGLVDGGGEPLGPQPLDAEGLAALRRCDPAGQPLPGLVLVGSHVPLADQQLETLLSDPRCEGLELPVARIARVLEGGTPDLLLADLEREWQARLRQLLADGRTPVLFTSRGELRFGEGAQADRRRLAFGMDLARLMARLAAACVPQLGYLISKGGITTGTLLAEGLGLGAVQLEGQLLPGLSLVRPLLSGEMSGELSADSAPLSDVLAADLAGLPILTFPGNLGDASTLAQAWRLMDRGV
ncbi:four-carbon acid sugar kinase family protein [Synechococcus sp. NOUM97013]|uniref:four-carbon acid sugar kinase family protein n=1 Tax=Synechococcus sp. NOUM97013 TaxID=1442555 RepID=UPI00164864CA|nr:four-carbon acid sugar kinase family protein [Synechococcus sp. NOUM97013]QNI72281.1 putative sugar and nucleotide-binding domains containing protein [Synechococcus sp. NOUM97013]